MPIAKDMTRVTVNLKTSLVERIDEYARSMNINRTSAVSVLLTQSLDTTTALETLQNITKIYQNENKDA